jgi:5-methyltetrahydropteroyltriglutamate--homocysteine methyltransferase
VVGSLLRPEYLQCAYRSLAKAEISPGDYKALEERAIDEAVDLQTRCGLEVVSDGEMRREHFFCHLADSFEWFDRYRAGP